MSRNSPEIRQVTSTRGRPNTAGGSTSTPVTRPVPSSHTGRHPISASPCAISSPPVRRLALPQRSITSARGQSPCSCANRRSASSAAAFPSAVGRPRRQRPRIGGVEVAPRRQHVGPPPRRRPRRPRRHVPPVERRDQPRPLRRRARQPRALLPRRRPPEDVQPVLHRQILQVAQPGVDPDQRPLRIVARRDPGLPRQPARPRLRHDQPRQPLPPPPVQPLRLGILVHQPLQRPRAFAQARPLQRRRQMPQRHRRDPPLRLRRLAGIADDERIDHRQRPGHHLGKTRARQRHRLPRQPLQHPVRPHMHQRVALPLQPQPERHQRMPRRQRRIVILRPPVRAPPPVRRQRHDHVPEPHRPEPEDPVLRVRLRRPPGRLHRRARRCRHRRAGTPQAPARPRPATRAAADPRGGWAGRVGRCPAQAPGATPRSSRISSRAVSGTPSTPYPAARRSARIASTLAGTSSPTA